MTGSRSTAARATLIVGVLVVVIAAAVLLMLLFRKSPLAQPPACLVPSITAGDPEFGLTPEQMDNAATIAAVGQQLGMPDHAVTVALATAMQESKLTNLTSGDRDSAGLFQQRPSQGWGTYAQVTDPIHASMSFYEHLRTLPNWQTVTVTEAAQLVQHSGAPDAYAQWETEARSVAVALTGQTPGGLSCQNLTLTPTRASPATLARAEWGTSALAGTHSAARGWAMSCWLVAHAARLGIDSVSFGGRTWTASSGDWTKAGPAVNSLSWHQVPVTSGSAN